MATLQYVLHIFLQIITGKILLQYVFANVSLDGQFGEILPHTPCQKKVFFFSGMCCHMCLRITSLYKSCTTLLALKWLFFFMYTWIWEKYCPTLLAKKVFFFSGTCCHMYLQITSLCPTLLAKKKRIFLLWYVLPYVSSDHFPLQILHHTLSICLFRWPLQGNTSPHSLNKKSIFFSCVCC